MAVEVATWPPVDHVDLDGWTLGLSRGFTRRANSVVPRDAPPDVDRALDGVEAIYARHGLPAVVRVCSAARPDGLDDVLAARGYDRVAPTAVMVAALDPGLRLPPVPEGLAVRVEDEPSSAWLAGWLEVKTATAGGVDLDSAERILRGSPAAYVSAADAEGLAAVVRVAFAAGWAGISSLTVQPRARRRGLGRLLTLAALQHAAGRGAQAAFLQVEESNTPAVALYQGLGFVVADRYHYRHRPSQG